MSSSRAACCSTLSMRRGLAQVRRASNNRTRRSFFSSVAVPAEDDHATFASIPTAPTVSSSPKPKKKRYAPIYVAATRQHVGKTTTSLALMSGLQKRFPNGVGFMKPVGQQSLTMTETDGTTVQVDKDAALMKKYFQLDHISYRHVSPVLIPPGYTRDYLDGRITSTQQTTLIRAAFDSMQRSSDIVLCEGTGHVAVGSIVDASNADICQLLGAKMVLVANGGLGNSFDELQLNRNLCQTVGVDVAGVIINKVRPDKYEQTKHYLSKALELKWGPEIPLLGCIPDRPFLGCPALADIGRLFAGSQLVSGEEHRLRHYSVEDLQLVATSLEVFLKRLRHHRREGERKLFVCHSSRNDILLGYLMESVQRHHQRELEQQQHVHSSATTPIHSTSHTNDENWDTAMIVTGCAEHPISRQVLEIVTNLPASAPPVLLCQPPTDHVMQGLFHYTPKLNSEDNHRVEKAVQHYEPYIDFDLLLERMEISTGGEDDDSDDLSNAST